MAYQEDNIKMHCVIIKNGKVAHKQNCVADGYVHSAAGYGGGAGYEFRPIKGYGKIRVDSGIDYQLDARGEVIESSIVESHAIDEKPAIIRYRTPKSFKLLTKAQEEKFANGSLKFTPYTCFIPKKNAKFEFCSSKPLMG